MTSRPPFHVLIVGAGISGLTLAHSLNAANISWTLLEARLTSNPLSGAGVVIGPNGSRVLDQLNLFDRLSAQGQPAGNQKWWGTDGQLLYHDKSAEEIRQRFGYNPFGIDRTDFVLSLYNQLSKKECVHFNSKVVALENGNDRVRLTRVDGAVYEGDIAVGTDGIRSFIRSKMQEIVGSSIATGHAHPDQSSVTAAYRCIYGVSQLPTSMDSHAFHVNLDERERMMFAYATNTNRMTWVFELPLEKRLRGEHELPRQDQNAIATLLEPFKDILVAGCTTLGALWDTRLSARLAIVEEARHQSWTAGRLVCSGDAIHKMTPNLGQGANQSIESAAALASQFVHLLDSHKSAASSSPPPRLSQSDVEPYLQKYQTEREKRANTIVGLSSLVTHNQVYSHTLSERELRFMVGSPLADFYSRTCAGASRLEFLPEPARALASREKFARRGTGNTSAETKSARL